MTKKMLIDALHPEETRVVIADDNQVNDFDFVSTEKKQLKGNIYLAKITRVEPSLQAAFVEYGGGKQGFLPFSEIHFDYYQIPVSDRRKLMEEVHGDDASDHGEQNTHSSDSESGQQQDANPNAADFEAQNPSSQEPGQDQPQSLPEDLASQVQEHPAYLMQGAVDVSISEEVEFPLPHDQANDLPPDHDQAQIPHDAHDTSSDTTSESSETPAELGHEGESGTGEGVETLPNDEEERIQPRKNYSRRYKIQEVIRRGQIVLVQVIKEERGNKGCSLTTYLSLAGRYCVLMPNSPKDGGISRKIASADDRRRLKAISTEMRLADGMSVIIRTAGMDRTRAEIKRDYDYLVKLWNQIREDTLKSNAPALIYEESDIIKRAIRDQYANDIDELIVEGDEGYRAARDFMKLLLPSHTPKIKHYKEATPLFYAYGIEEQLLSMHDPIVKLRSGGYIVINPTEALISIDVNSGRATGERNIEETATKTNLEAAVEVARQLRLRDLAGLIVIDFIDMMDSRNRRSIEKSIRDALKTDRAKIQLGRISPFGLLEMSRQRLRPSIAESNMMQCPHCQGRGIIRSNESMSIQIIRSIEKEASANSWSSFRLIAPQAVALHLLNYKRDVLRAMEQRYNVTVQVLIGPELTFSEFNLEKMRRSQSDRQERPERSERPERPERVDNPERDRRPRRNERSERPRFNDTPMPSETPLDTAGEDESRPLETGDESAKNDAGRPRSRNRRRRGGRNRGERTSFNDPSDTTAPETLPQDTETGDAAAPAESGDAIAASSPPQRPRGRNRRPWRERGDASTPGETPRIEESANSPYTAQPSIGDGNALPAFATEAPVIFVPPPPLPQPAQIIPMDTPRDPSAPTRKGWWKKMIELDD